MKSVVCIQTQEITMTVYSAHTPFSTVQLKHPNEVTVSKMVYIANVILYEL